MKTYGIKLFTEEGKVEIAFDGTRTQALEVYKEHKEDWVKQYHKIQLVSKDEQGVKLQFEKKGISKTISVIEKDCKAIGEITKKAKQSIVHLNKEFEGLNNFQQNYNGMLSLLDKLEQVIKHDIEREAIFNGMNNINADLLKLQVSVLLQRRNLKMTEELVKTITTNRELRDAMEKSTEELRTKQIELKTKYNNIVTDSMQIRETTYKDGQERKQKLEAIKNTFDNWVDFGNGTIKYWNKVFSETNCNNKNIEDIEGVTKLSEEVERMKSDINIPKVDFSKGESVARVMGSSALCTCKNINNAKLMAKQMRKKYRTIKIYGRYVYLNERKCN